MTKLIDVCDFQGGSQPPKKEWITEPLDGYIRMLQIRDFTQNNKTIPEFVKCSDNLRLCTKDDVLIARYGASLGKILTGLSGAYNVAMIKVIPDENVLTKRYLYYYLCSPYFQQSILNVGNRAAQAGFNKTDLSKLKIDCKTIGEQKKMVKVLDTISQTIHLKKKQIDKLDTLIKARFVEMFGDPVENNKEFEVNKLSQIGKCKNGMNFNKRESGFKINCLTVKDFKENTEIKNTAILPKIELSQLPSQDYFLKNGDIIFVRSNGNKSLVGRSILVYPDDIPTIFSGFCIRFRNNKDYVTPLYLLFFFKNTSVRLKIRGRGINIQNLNQTVLNNLDVPIPPIELQNEFASFVQQVDKSKVAIQKSLDETKTLFDSLMQKYFS